MSSPSPGTTTLVEPNRVVVGLATAGLVALASAGTAVLVLTGTSAVLPGTSDVPPLPRSAPLAKAPGVVILPSSPPVAGSSARRLPFGAGVRTSTGGGAFLGAVPPIPRVSPVLAVQPAAALPLILALQPPAVGVPIATPATPATPAVSPLAPAVPVVLAVSIPPDLTKQEQHARSKAAHQARKAGKHGGDPEAQLASELAGLRAARDLPPQDLFVALREVQGDLTGVGPSQTDATGSSGPSADGGGSRAERGRSAHGRAVPAASESNAAWPLVPQRHVGSQPQVGSQPHAPQPHVGTQPHPARTAHRGHPSGGNASGGGAQNGQQGQQGQRAQHGQQGQRAQHGQQGQRAQHGDQHGGHGSQHGSQHGDHGN